MTELPNPPKKIISNIEELYVHSQEYAKEYGEGLPELEQLLKYCFKIRTRVVYCSKGNNDTWAYIYFACPDREMIMFSAVINRYLLAENIAGFNYEIRAKVDYLSTEKLRGVIFRCKHYAAAKMFSKITFALQNRNAFSNRDVVGKFNSIIANFEMRRQKTDQLELIYNTYKSVKEEDIKKKKGEEYLNVIKFSEIPITINDHPITINDHPITYNGELKLLSSLQSATSEEELKGIFQVDMDLADFNSVVLKKIFK